MVLGASACKASKALCHREVVLRPVDHQVDHHRGPGRRHLEVEVEVVEPLVQKCSPSRPFKVLACAWGVDSLNDMTSMEPHTYHNVVPHVRKT